MIKKVFSVYDAKARVYSNPFYAIRTEVAIRDFHRAATDPSSEISRFPLDYVLFLVGEFDDEACTFTTSEVPINLGDATQFFKE